ncbi:MAG TPA: HisA/HisF-related TIM barrel protein [Gemmataceae bacterium]|nr:HisA/HisF-related TIM barrel protein [Gemmataceae bacterium]
MKNRANDRTPILPVIDLLHGEVVRGVGGRRSEYRPVRSCLTNSSRPLDVAEAFRETFGFTELYLADLDAILGAEPAFEQYATLRNRGFRLWLDAGVQQLADANRLAEAGIETIVLGLETLREPWEFCRILREHGPERVVFSLDMKDGKPLAGNGKWMATDALELAKWIIHVGGRRLLLLDLASVGGDAGPGSESLCEALAASHPDVEISTGGGIRGIDDVKRLQKFGVANVLVASALHDGRITAAKLRIW